MEYIMKSTEHERYLDKLADLEAMPRRRPCGKSFASDMSRPDKLTAIARREKRLREAKDEIRCAIPRAVEAGHTLFHDAVAWICQGLSSPQDSRDDRFRTENIVGEVMLEGLENSDGLTRWGAALAKA